MDFTNLPAILGGIGTVVGAVSLLLQRRSDNTNKRFEITFGQQTENLKELKDENRDLRQRLTNAEKAQHDMAMALIDCERSKSREQAAMQAQIDVLTRKLAELQGMIPNGSSVE
jgi:polyhydroxyalkanoate synthesis regulator phasin